MVGPFGFRPNKTMHSRALGLARSLVMQGHVVSLFMPPWQTPAEADRLWFESGVGVRYVPLRGGTLGITGQMIREVLAWEPAVVHCFKPKAYSGLVAWWLWHLYRGHLHLVMDSDDWEGWGGWNDLAPYTRWQKWFFAWQEQWGMRHCHHLTVASRTLQSLAWGMGINPQHISYVPNGPGIGETVPLNDTLQAIVTQLQERPSLLLYSRLFEFDTERLVKILQGVKEAVPDLAILSIGTGLYQNDAATLRQQLTAANLRDTFIDVGWVETAQLPTLLAATKVGIYLMEDSLLNRAKCPVKLADMLSIGVPVVAEAVGQVPEYVVNGRTGYLRPTGDVAGLTADVVALLQDEERRLTLTAQAKTHITTHFSWPVLAERLLAEAYS